MQSTEKQIRNLQNNLNMLRKLFGWSAEQLGDRLDVTKQTISNLENCKIEMTRIQYIAIRSVMEQEALNREESERDNLLKVMLAALDELEDTSDAQRKTILETAEVVANARFNGVPSAMSVLTPAVDKVSTGKSLAMLLAGASVVAAGTMMSWLGCMLENANKEEQRKKKGRNASIHRRGNDSEDYSNSEK